MTQICGELMVLSKIRQKYLINHENIHTIASEHVEMAWGMNSKSNRTYYSMKHPTENLVHMNTGAEL